MRLLVGYNGRNDLKFGTTNGFDVCDPNINGLDIYNPNTNSFPG